MVKLAAALALTSAFLLSGCGNGIVSDNKSVAAPATGVHGTVHGGNQPVTGATITLMSVGTSGYGSTGSTLATTSTDGNGNFSITGSYTCPAGDPYVYITSTGGNPGLASGTNNTAIDLIAALTDCNSLKTNAATTFININEETTVAAAYALAQFMNTSTGGIGSYGYANTGLVNAMLTAGNLVNSANGTAYSVTPGNNGVAPQTELNTLGNILASCVNTTSNASSGCTTLFGDAQGSPANTLLAALSIALHPGYHVGTLFGLASSITPFQPALSAAPNDWTVALAFNDSAPSPRDIAIDGSGNVWVAVFNTGGTSSSVNKINPLGVLQNFVTTDVNGAQSLTISDTNNVWVSNANNTLVQYGNTPNVVSGPFTGLDGTIAMAMDPFGNLWIANHINSTVAEFNTSTNSFTSTGYSAGITSPDDIAIDPSGNAWVGNASTVTELNDLGVPSSASPISGGGISSPGGGGGIAIDGSNNVWISNSPTGSAVAELNSSGSPLSGSGYTGTGIASATGIAIDGGANVWISEQGLSRLSELTSGGVPAIPSPGYYQGGNLNGPHCLAIDESGNIWLANNTSTTTGSITTTISEFVGLAVPVVTPKVIALEQGQLGVRPGNPIPVVIQSVTIPYYSPGNNYGAQLLASGGNSSSYNWTITSGALPSPLTLSTGGLITGTTSLTGSYTFGVKACDAQNLSNCSGSTSFTLTANTNLTPLGNEAALTGSYAMNFEGFKNGSGAGLVEGSDFVGQVTFNGSGTLTGEIDSNNYKSSSTSNKTITGYYTFGSDNRGTMVIVPSGGTNGEEFAITGSNLSGSTPQTLRFMEFDDTNPGVGGLGLATGAGIAKMQNSGAFTTTTLGQSWVFGLQGETPCNNDGGVNASCATISPFGTLSAVGKFTANTSNSIPSGEEDVAAYSNTYNLIGLSGSYTSPDTSGRGTLTLTPTGTLYPAPPSHYVYYLVGSGEMYVMSSDGHASTSLLSGDVLAQSGSFSNSTPSGNYVIYEQSQSNGDGVAQFPTQPSTSLTYVTVQSGSQLAITIDKNNAQGVVQLEQSQGPFSYAVDSNGRMTIGGGGTGSPVFYLANSTAFFGTEQPSASQQGNGGLMIGQQQSSGTFGCSGTSGGFAFGSAPSPIADSLYTGHTNLTLGTITLDQSDAYYGLLAQGVSGTITCAGDSLTTTTGRVVYSVSFGTGGIAAYPIVPNQSYVEMSIDPTDTNPSILVVGK